MKLRIFTSMLVLVVLSVLNSFTASANPDCKGGNCCDHHWRHRGCCDHHYGYIYGPDGAYARHKACCDKKEEKSCCAKKSECKHECEYTYRRARYYEDCCGWGHLHYADDKDSE